MQQELKDIQKRLGIAFIYITHDQEEALNMSDRIAIMRDTNVSARFCQQLFHRLKMGRATFDVDIHTIETVVDHMNRGAQLFERCCSRKR